MHKNRSVFTRYPVLEIIFTILAVVVSSLFPWESGSQRLSVGLFVAASVVVALVWHFLALRSSGVWLWIHILVGSVCLALEAFVFAKIQTSILDILLIPSGTGVIIAAVSEGVRRVPHSEQARR